LTDLRAASDDAGMSAEGGESRGQNEAAIAVGVSERLLREAQRVARVGSWEWDVATNRLTWSEILCALYGIPADSPPTSYDEYIALVHPDDREATRGVSRRAMTDHAPFAFDHRVIHPDGTVRVLHGRGEIITDDAGNVVRFVGSSEDVTDRAAAEAAEREARRAAERAVDRVRRLQSLSDALSSAITLDAVAEVIVQQGIDMLGADAAFVARVTDDGERAEILHSRGFDDALLSDLARFALTDKLPTTLAIRTRSPVWIESALDRDASYDGRFLTIPFVAAAVLPLITDGRAIGAIGFRFRGERSFPPEDRDFVGALAGQYAQSLHRASLFDAERRARAAAERGRRRTEQLQELTAALAAATNEHDVATITLGHALDALAAPAGTVVRVSEDEASIEIVAHSGYGADVATRFRRCPLTMAMPTTDAIRAGEPLRVDGVEALAARHPDLVDVFAAMGATGYASLPLRVADRTIGGLAIYLAEPLRFDDDEWAMLKAFAGQCAQAMARVRHLAAEHRARETEAFLAAAGAALAESLDRDTTLQRLAELTVPNVADLCVLYLTDGPSDIRRVALAGAPDQMATFAEMERRHPLHRASPGAVPRVINDGSETIALDVSDEQLRELAQNEELFLMLRRLAARSLVMVPLRLRGTITGALLLGWGADRPVDPRDVVVARRLADRAALAIENARLYADAEAARADAEASRHRVAVIAEASRLLVGSLEYEVTLQRVAESVIPQMGDWCTVDLLNDVDGIDLVAVAHADADTAAWGRRLRERFPIDLDGSTGIATVLRARTPAFVPMVDDATLVAAARTPDELAVLREIGCRSYMCVPLHVRSAVIGAITFAHAGTSNRRYDEADLAVAEELARRAATAIDHARAYRAAQKANRVKGEFLAVMSHELRTPLNAIGGYVELLELGLRGPLNEAQLRDLARIRISQQHLLGLISGVLDLSRIESGRVTYELEPIPVDAFLQSLDALIAPQVASKSLTLEYAPCPSSLAVRADREKLRQVVLNLLSNAVRYTPAGGGIRLTAEPREGAIAIIVTDTGIGIPADALDRIFEPFVQLDRSLTRGRDGVGLGLAISRDLARGMGGDLVATSETGAGSTFTLLLAAAIVDEPLVWRATAEMGVIGDA
jgi:PAS domain S-box-containing protein